MKWDYSDKMGRDKKQENIDEARKEKSKSKRY